MKHLAIFCLSLVTTTVFAGDETGLKGLPDFWVVKTQEGDTPKDSAIFQFQVMNQELWPKGVQKYSLASCNSQPFPFVFDQTGNCSLVVAPGKYRFQFYIVITGHSTDSLGYGNYYEIYSDSVSIEKGMITSVQLRFRPADQEMMVDKPVLYLYSEQTIAFSASVKPVGQFTFTYPSIENGWNGKVSPKGTVQIGDRTYPYLFWEAKCPLVAATTDLSEGFIVPGNETVAFLEKQLSAMGLNDREQTDFITYWGPKLSGNASNFVHFLFNNSCNTIADLTITPQPDNQFRVYMIWSELSNNSIPSPSPQIIPNFKRNGFTVVEWGGSEVSIDELQLKTANR